MTTDEQVNITTVVKWDELEAAVAALARDGYTDIRASNDLNYETLSEGAIMLSQASDLWTLTASRPADTAADSCHGG